MPAATNKAELMAVTGTEFSKLTGLIDGLSSKDATATDADGIAIKDIIAHRAHWIGLFLGWYDDGQVGNPVYFPAQGYKWNDLNRYNADLRVKQARLSWDDTRASLYDQFARLTEFIAEHSDAQLYGGPMKGAKNDWTTGRWAEAAGPSHFRSAAKYVRKVLKTRG